jgi:uroporphyrinogen-III synthase
MSIKNPSGRAAGLSGLRIVSFESRRAQDMALLIRRSGGEVLYAPSMREIPLADERGILDFGARLFDGMCDALILLTGVGTTILVDALSTRWPRTAVLERLAQTPLLCRGPKPVSVLRGLGLSPAIVAPEPHTAEALLQALDRGFDVKQKRVYVQEYGVINAELRSGLLSRGALVTPVKVYRWALPEDTRDLRSALQSIAQRRVDAAIFTSAHQVDNVLEYAARLSLVDALRDAFKRSVLVISIGPVTSEALLRHGIEADLSPDQPKIGPLVESLARHASQLQRLKRSAALN